MMNHGNVQPCNKSLLLSDNNPPLFRLPAIAPDDDAVGEFLRRIIISMYAVYVGRAVVPSRGRPMSQQATKRASKLLLAWGYMVLN